MIQIIVAAVSMVSPLIYLEHQVGLCGSCNSTSAHCQSYTLEATDQVL